MSENSARSSATEGFRLPALVLRVVAATLRASFPRLQSHGAAMSASRNDLTLSDCPSRPPF
jgi:hypothetical protein